jgi:dephospho-CoA kinase
VKKILIGFAGEMGSGKGTAAALVLAWFPGTESFRFSESLREFYTHFRVLHQTKEDKAPWLFFREALTGALEASFGDGVLCGAPEGALALFARWLLDEFVPRHKGRWPKKASTPDLQDLSTKVRQYFAEDTLEKAIVARVGRSASTSPYAVVDGIRRLVDIGRLMSAPENNFHLCYIEADTKKRHERHRARNEKPGDADLTIDQFIALGQAEAEKEIRLLKPHAHSVITNNGTQEEFAAQLKKEIMQWRAH